MMTPRFEAELKACLHGGPAGTVAVDGRDIPGFEHAITLITTPEIRDWTLSEEPWPPYMYLGLMRETWRQYLERNPPPALTPLFKRACAVRRPFRVREMLRTG